MRHRNFTCVIALALAAAFAAPVASANRLAGRLRTSGNKPVVVNGNKVVTGTTVFSGAQIESPEKVGATIEIDSLGRIDMAPQTRLTLTFAGGRIEVSLQSGYAVLTTEKGVAGSVNVDGKTLTTDPSKQSSVEAKSAGSGEPRKAGIAGKGGVSAKTVGVVAGAGAAAAGAAAAGSRGRGRGRNVSPSTPGGN